MAKVICKGTVLQQYIAGVPTAVAQIIELDRSGHKTETTDGRTLDGTAGIQKLRTGFYEPGDMSFTVFYDPALAGHQAIRGTVDASSDTIWRITYADTDGSQESMTSVGTECGVAIKANDGLKMSVKLELTGNVTLPD